jgi:hypothetical protein
VNHLAKAIGGGWDCKDVNNYDVEYTIGTGSPHRVKLARVDLPQKCEIIPPETLPAVHIVFLEEVHLNATYGVTITVDGKTAGVTGIQFAGVAASQNSQPTGPATFSFNPQSVLNEPLSDGTYKGVEQFGISYATPGIGSKGLFQFIYLNSNNIISTNEKDNKSAFDFALGYRHGLLKSWYFPFSIEEAVQGNQIATSLSAVTTMAFATELPWQWAAPSLNNKYISIPLSPELSLNFPYTHRYNQVVAPKKQPLVTDDFAVVPAISFAHNTLLPKVCSWYQSFLVGKGAPMPASPSNQFCLGFEADFGLYYLPLDLTARGNQRVEGYGDFSFLVPLTDFQWPFVPQALGKQALQTQLRIKYADSVSATNNYARTKRWSFGMELIK